MRAETTWPLRSSVKTTRFPPDAAQRLRDSAYAGSNAQTGVCARRADLRRGLSCAERRRARDRRLGGGIEFAPPSPRTATVAAEACDCWACGLSSSRRGFCGFSGATLTRSGSSVMSCSTTGFSTASVFFADCALSGAAAEASDSGPGGDRSLPSSARRNPSPSRSPARRSRPRTPHRASARSRPVERRVKGERQKGRETQSFVSPGRAAP